MLCHRDEMVFYLHFICFDSDVDDIHRYQVKFVFKSPHLSNEGNTRVTDTSLPRTSQLCCMKMYKIDLKICSVFKFKMFTEKFKMWQTSTFSLLPV